MNARDLIANAWYLSGIVSRDLEVVSNSQSADGLRMLNNILAEKSMTGRYIPYYTHIDFPLVVGQEVYTVPNLIEVDVITFNIDTVRYHLARARRRPYFGEGRIDDIDSLPYQYYFEREKDGAKIYLYFRPSDDFLLKITGKFSLGSVTLDTELTDSLDQYYISYLEYALAERLSNFYNFPFAPNHRKVLDELEEQLVDITPKDFSITKISTLKKTPALTWADVNLGNGWRP